MENLPAEWVEKIDHVETLADGRIVAVAKLTDAEIAAGLKPQVRELQWDDAKGEWIPYVPQVGLVGTQMEYWDRTAKSDELSGVELQAITAEPIYGKDGQEIKPGLVADFSDATLFCGDLVEVNALQGGTEFIFKVTLATGDIELFQVGILAGQAGLPNAVYDQAAIDPSQLVDPGRYSGSPMGAVLKEFPQGVTSAQLYEYFLKLGQNVPVRMLFAVQKTNSELAVHDDANARRGLAAKFEQGDAFDQDDIGIILYNYPVMTEEVLNDLLQ